MRGWWTVPMALSYILGGLVGVGVFIHALIVPDARSVSGQITGPCTSLTNDTVVTVLSPTGETLGTDQVARVLQSHGTDECRSSFYALVPENEWYRVEVGSFSTVVENSVPVHLEL